MAEVDGLVSDIEAAALDAGEHEEILDQAVEAVRLAHDVLQEVVAGLRIHLAPAPGQHARAPEDRGDRRPELVRHDPDERVAQSRGVPLQFQVPVSLLLGEPAVRDVARGTHQPGRPPTGRRDQPADAVKPPDRSVGAADPELLVVGGAVAEACRHRRLDPWPVARIQHRQPGDEVRLRSLREAVELEHLRRPFQAVCCRVPLPRPCSGSVQGEPQPLVAVPEGREQPGALQGL